MSKNKQVRKYRKPCKENNQNLEFYILEDKIMKEALFRKVKETRHWYYHRMFTEWLSIDITIPFDEDKEASIDVLDERCLQPFDYQAGFGTDKYTKMCKAQVEATLAIMQGFGIIKGHKEGDYV